MRTVVSFFSTGSLIDLSAQELVDCNFIFTHGCDGGSLTGAYMFGQSNGVTSEQEYPYTGFKGMCDFKKVEKQALKVTDFFQVDINGDENVLKEFVATYGPVAALVNVKSSFGLYHSGVYYEPGNINICIVKNHVPSIKCVASFHEYALLHCVAASINRLINALLEVEDHAEWVYRPRL